MEYHSWGKINLTLRILGRNDRGYHELISLFWKIGPFESLTVEILPEGCCQDELSVSGAAVDGPNILEKTLYNCRKSGSLIPWLRMNLKKQIPPGTGLGCGSGNAAALMEWLALQGYNVGDLAPRVGADVPFFLGSSALARVSGIGEILEPLKETLPLRVLIALPVWRSMTASAFRELDSFYGTSWPSTYQDALEESNLILDKLKAGRFVGLLPNDFTGPLMVSHREYQELFEAFQSQGALAWGISGSGSAAFGLWHREDVFDFSFRRPWLERPLTCQLLL